jgi:hypothetical protein
MAQQSWFASPPDNGTVQWQFMAGGHTFHMMYAQNQQRKAYDKGGTSEDTIMQ